MKTCSKCKLDKEYDQFHKSCRTKDGYVSACKDCEQRRKKETNTPEVLHQRYLKKQSTYTARQREYYWNNRDQCREASKKRYQRNKPKWKQLGWKQKGIFNEQGLPFTLLDFDRILLAQNGVCKICGSKGENHGKGLCVDHDHTTGIVRGILCGFCNTAISYLQDDPKLLTKAIEYLDQKSLFDQSVREYATK